MWRSAQAALLALFVAVSTLAGGTSYLFCSMTDSVVTQCCCDDDDDDGPLQTEVHRSSDCCEKKTVGKLPQGFGAGALVLDAAPAVLDAAPIALAPAPWSERAPRVHVAPTGPPELGRRLAQNRAFLL